MNYSRRITCFDWDISLKVNWGNFWREDLVHGNGSEFFELCHCAHLRFAQFEQLSAVIFRSVV